MVRLTALLACALIAVQAVLTVAASASGLPHRLDPTQVLADSAQPPEMRHLEVLAALEGAGYTLVELRRTWLNRVLIRARNDLHLREIVISRSTGLILRDVVLETYGPDGSPGARWPSGMPPEDISPDEIDPELFR